MSEIDWGIPHRIIDGIDCFGEWREDSNAMIVGDDPDGNEFSVIYADGADSWEDLIKILTTAPVFKGYDIAEISAV
jgi:hypothetical protein